MADEIDPEKPLFVIGPYQVLKTIGQGGMGDVFLAYDTVCKRNVALKCLSQEHSDKAARREQFLQEAHTTGTLSHPSIIPIYAIGREGDRTYYTMPFIEGKTLKGLIYEEIDTPNKSLLGQISSCSHIFLQIVKAVAYAHSKGLLHRDLKPSNIMVGSYGEVTILDWGLVKMANGAEKQIAEKHIEGTMSYMAPELVTGSSPTFQSEIYSLGLILYQMLTLRHPFHRSTVQEYCDTFDKEVCLAPDSVAPYRNVPPVLSHITLKCLEQFPQNRYQSVEELLGDLQTYVEALPNWIHIAHTDLQKESDWTRVDEATFLSTASYPSDIKIEAKVRSNQRIDLYLCASPKTTEWGPKIELQLEKERTYDVCIEKRDAQYSLFLNGQLESTTIDYLPRNGGHIGIVTPAGNYAIEDIHIFISGTSFRVNPLEKADLLFAQKKYAEARQLYQEKSHALAHTHDGLKAFFYVGLTLLKEGKKEAISAFEALHHVNASPLYYLGKALFYESEKEYEQEARCYEEAFRLFPHHELIKEVKAELQYRLQSALTLPRNAAAALILLACRFLNPEEISAQGTKVITQFKNSLEPLFFFKNEEPEKWALDMQQRALALQLAFCLARPDVIAECLDELLKMDPAPLPHLQNGLLALIEIGDFETAALKLEIILQRFLDVQAIAKFEWIQSALHIHIHKNGFDDAFIASLPQLVEGENLQPLWHILEEALEQKKTDVVYKASAFLHTHLLSYEQFYQLEYYLIWAALFDGNVALAQKLLEQYPLVDVAKEAIPLNFLYGCFIGAHDGKKQALRHFSAIPKAKLSPPWHSFLMLIKESKKLEAWLKDAFLWEKQRLFSRALLFYHCCGDKKKIRALKRL